MSKIQVDDIVNKDDNGAPSFPYGATFTDNIVGTAASFTGIVTATSLSVTDITATGNVSIAGTLTYEDVTNVDSIGIITARSDISIADKIIHTGDTDTAIRFPAADTFTVETAGSERVRVDSSGRVGIGTDSISSLLHVRTASAGAVMFMLESDLGTNNNRTLSVSSPATDSSTDPYIVNTANSLQFQVDSANRLHINSDGNIGIGTDNPTTKLQIVGSTDSTESSGGTLAIRQKGDTAADGITITSSHGNSGRIFKDVDGKLHIYNTGTSSDQFVLDNSGNIGIGTDNPTTKLDVDGNATFTGYVSANTATGDWVATQSDAETGTDNTKIMTPLRVAQAIAALGGSVINSIQRGIITTSSNNTNTATISSVNTSKTMVNHLGGTTFVASSQTNDMTRLTLTNSTTVTLIRSSTSGGSTTHYEVIEFV